MMDVAGLRNCIASTLTANAEIRQTAEQQLKQAESSPGFIGALLDIVASEQDANVRLSSVVYLKNRVTRAWDSSDDYAGSSHKPIPEGEKPAFRDRLIPLLAQASPQVRQHILTIIGKILNYDFPDAWPNYVEITMNLLTTSDIQSVYAGLQCLSALCRTFRFKTKDAREDFDRVSEVAFPIILQIGTRLLDETSAEAGEMMKLILKCYKHAIFMDLAPHLQAETAIVPWATLFIKVVEKETPQEALGEDIDERAQHPWWKAKKWAYSNLNRLFVRYGNPNTLSKGNGDSYMEFSKSFIINFAPSILTAYLRQIDLWVSKQIWLSKVCLSFIVSYLDECVKPKTTWEHLKPHMNSLVAHVLFPLLCQTPEDLELFEDDPAEYLHRKLNFYEDVASPDVAAVNFLNTVAKHRRKQTFTILNFINEVVNRYEAATEAEKNHVEKEGALRMIGTLSSIILAKKSPVADKVEYFFVRHVFPEFRSAHGYLRARACNVLEKFSDLNFEDQNNIIVIYQNILACLEDPALPVRIEAALALQTLIRHDAIRTAMQQNITHIMQQLLKLTNEVELDQLANVMEEFVEVFASELTPFAVELTEQLRDTYLRIIGDIIEKGGNDEDGILTDDKSITALGVLQTIGTLILTLESTPEVLLHLENVLVPVITTTLENRLYDLYNEVFEIIDSCTFSAKSISPTMWAVFELVHRTFKDRAEIYVEDMLPALDNYITYGSEMLRQNQGYFEAIIDIIQTIFTHDKLGAMDRICGCKLAESVLLSVRGGADQYLAGFVEIGMTKLTNDKEPKVRSYQIHLLEMVINCVYYNPLATLHVLEAHNWTNSFFTLWFTNIDHFRRVHDKKLSIVAIVSLLQLGPEQIPASVQPGWHRLLQGVVRLFDTLPVAMKNREEATKDPYGGEEYDDGADSDGWEESADAWDNEAEDVEDDIGNDESAYLEFLSGDGLDDYDDDDDLDEESLIESQLDKIEPYTLFRDTFVMLKASHPQLYENLTNALSRDEQAVLESVVEIASTHDVAAAQLANGS